MDTLPVSAANTSPSLNTSACLHPSTTTVSRLISVVEVIKREYFKTLETTRSTRRYGLHQYNEIGTLEDLGLVVASSNQTADAKELESAQEVERSRNIIEAISGKHLLVLSFHLFSELNRWCFKHTAKRNTFYAYYTFD